MDENNIQLSQALASKICHDVIGPISAIANGLELLADNHENEMVNQVIPLLKEGSSRALDILQFFRLIIGSGYQGVGIKLQEIRDLTNAYFSINKIKITLPQQVNTFDLNHNIIRPVLLQISILTDLMPKGGHVVISENKTGLRIVLSSTDFRCIDDLEKIYSGHNSQIFLNSKKILWFLLAVYLKEAKCRTELVKGQSDCTINYWTV
ncbi:MAG TPA: histidine phosphotransferase family protein [Alphaproteobacteria bacterium]|nr:histidine phosphotransferase family protein [Alphaproteobacteria bacterium]